MLKIYWRTILKHNLGAIGFTAFLAGASSLLEAIGIGLVVPVMNLLIADGVAVEDPIVGQLYNWLFDIYPNLTHKQLIFAILLIIAAIICCKNLFDLLRMRWVRRFSTQIANEFRLRMFGSFLAADYSEVIKRGRGAIVQNMEAVSNSVQTSVTSTAVLIHAVVYSFWILTLLLYLSWWVTAFIGVLGFAGTYIVRKSLESPAHKIGVKSQDTSEKVSKLIVDSIDGIRIVKTQNIQELVLRRLDELQRPLVDISGRMSLLVGFSNTFFEIYSFALIVAIMAIILTKPQLGIGFPELAAVIIAMRRIQPNISNINLTLVGMSYTLRQVEIADDVLNDLTAERSGNRRLPSSPYAHITVDSLSFYYPQTDGRYVLKDIKFNLWRGQVVAIVGPTGAGKSTLVDLLARLYNPVAGSIKADGVDIGELDLDEWRNSIGYVSQDTYLFNASIYDNIALWEKYGDEQVRRAAEAARLHDFVTTLSEGYDTIVGDRGVKLSGGQRQRVAIARALIKHPSLLIFDEATSALDNVTEQEIQDNVNALKAQAMVLIIAHRLSTVEDADLILVVDEGRIVEADSHQNLIGRKGEYHLLYTA